MTWRSNSWHPIQFPERQRESRHLGSDDSQAQGPEATPIEPLPRAGEGFGPLADRDRVIESDILSIRGGGLNVVRGRRDAARIGCDR